VGKKKEREENKEGRRSRGRRGEGKKRESQTAPGINRRTLLVLKRSGIYTTPEKRLSDRISTWTQGAARGKRGMDWQKNRNSVEHFPEAEPQRPKISGNNSL